VTRVTDRLPDLPLKFLVGEGQGYAMGQTTIWKEITTAFEGRAIGGSWAVEGGHVRVKTALGEKLAPLEGANGIWVAWRLLREMAADGKA
jgi:hypothetical protein